MKKRLFTYLTLILVGILTFSCAQQTNKKESTIKTAVEILGNPEYPAISYGGFRHKDRGIEPTLPELKEDMKILSAMGIKLLRTYNVKLLEASNLLKVIREMKEENPEFEMYLMLGAWIDCKDARTESPNHDEESEENAAEIDRAVALAAQYPDIVKIIAVGNEAMVKWATGYYVQAATILKWVNHLQNLKKEGKLPESLWITSSDNFASWGGGESEYHTEDLNKLIKAVDYISMHTYPMHDTHYNPDFWGVPEGEENLSDFEKIDAAMLRAREYSIAQYESVSRYVKAIDETKTIHIGETGWASQSNEHYGDEGSRATDEYKSAIFYNHMMEWTKKAGVTCFYFEAFDEQWKDSANPAGSENHFGLINLQSQAKYVLWDMVESGVFDGLTRDGKAITKTYKGEKDVLMRDVKVPPRASEIKKSN
ncbi:MAG: glycosyl hydrolase family 17 [Saprospiraceae bacterium]|nr:glycosyl hydrolase family 17 [Saprospiraceae bacterium]